MKIPLFKVFMPSNMGEILQRDVFDSGIVTEGVWSQTFQEKLSKYTGTKNNVLVNSGTSALTLAYILSDVGPGKNVISSPMTCMATNEPIDTLGANIIWVDIDPNTGNIDPDDLINLYDRNACALSAVHWAGSPYNMKEVWELAKRHWHDIKVIDDAAHAFGAEYRGKKIGQGVYSDFSCFSFQAIKHLTTIDGGLLTCQDDTHTVTARKLRWFGLDRNHIGSRWSQDITQSGYKFHMNNMNARIGVEQLNYVDNIIGAHRSNAQFYDEHITNPKIKKLSRDPNSTSSFWIYTVRVDDRQKFIDYMNSKDIDTDVTHVRNDAYTVFKKFQTRQLPGCDEFCSTMINIPVGWWLTDDTRAYIVDMINKY